MIIEEKAFMVYNMFHHKMMSIHVDEDQAIKQAQDDEQFFGDKMLVAPVAVLAEWEEKK